MEQHRTFVLLGSAGSGKTALMLRYGEGKHYHTAATPRVPEHQCDNASCLPVCGVNVDVTPADALERQHQNFGVRTASLLPCTLGL